MDDLIIFMYEYGGMIFGILVAVVLLLTKLYLLIISIILIVVCGYAGHYFQHNKDSVKDKLKNFIDRI